MLMIRHGESNAIILQAYFIDNSSICSTKMIELSDDLANYYVNYDNFHASNILRAPQSDTTAKCPIHDDYHTWRLIDFRCGRVRKESFTIEVLHRYAGSSVDDMLDELEAARWDVEAEEAL